MTARYNVFKESSVQPVEPLPGGQFVGVAQCYDQTRQAPPPGTHTRHSNSVANVPNVRRGEDVSN